MQDEQKQIEGMAQAMSDFVLEDSVKCDIELSKHLIAKGYRKQSDTAREILKWLKLLYSERQKEYTNWDGKKINAITTEWLNSDIETIAAEYGVEVEQ